VSTRRPSAVAGCTGIGAPVSASYGTTCTRSKAHLLHTSHAAHTTKCAHRPVHTYDTHPPPLFSCSRCMAQYTAFVRHTAYPHVSYSRCMVQHTALQAAQPHAYFGCVAIPGSFLSYALQSTEIHVCFKPHLHNREFHGCTRRWCGHRVCTCRPAPNSRKVQLPATLSL
jgi:hypothetical protein